jgi:hypothetical protein
LLAAVVGAFTVLACDDSSTDPETAPDVATMQLMLDSDTITIAHDGSVTGGPAVISGTVDIAAEFLDTEGELADDVTDDRYEIAGSDDENIVTFTLTDGFAGGLTGLLSGESTTVSFALYDTEQGIDIFGPFAVDVDVQ